MRKRLPLILYIYLDYYRAMCSIFLRAYILNTREDTYTFSENAHAREASAVN